MLSLLLVMETLHRYRIELCSNDPHWINFRTTFTAEGRDGQGKPCGRVATHNFDENSSRTLERLSIVSPPCATFEAYLYIIPHTLPKNNAIGEVGEIKASLSIFDGESLLRKEELSVNPWGGITRRLLLGD